ncbi:MAG: type IV pilus modification PilV family protein [Bacillota bacterium]
MVMYGSIVPRKIRRGFTLLEAALVTCIVGVGITSLLQLMAAGTVCNTTGTELTTGLNLAKNIREMTLGLAFADPTSVNRWDPSVPPHWGPESDEPTVQSYDDVDDLDGASFNPPIDARRQSLTEFANWTQSIKVTSVDPDYLPNDKVGNGKSPAIRITCTITHLGQHVCELSWMVFDGTP